MKSKGQIGPMGHSNIIMDIVKLTGGSKDLQMRYITEVGADNAKTKSRIAFLKAEIDCLEPQGPTGKLASPIKTTFSVPIKPSIAVTAQAQPESPGPEIVLTASQEQQANIAIEESLRTKVEGLNRIKEGIQILHVEIDDKVMKKEELAKLYEQKKVEVEKAEKDLKADFKKLSKEVDFDAIYSKRELLNLKKEIEETQIRLNKTHKSLEVLAKEREMNEKLLEEIKREADDTYAFKVAKAKTVIAPLEDAATIIESQREKLAGRIRKEQAELQHSYDILFMQEEDYIGREMQRTELTRNRKTLLEQMSSFRENYKEELQLFFEELEIEEQLEEVIREKRKVESKLTRNEKARLELAAKFQEHFEATGKLQAQLKTNEGTMLEAIIKDELEISQLEDKIKEKLKEAGSEGIGKILLDEMQKKGFLYSKTLFLIQKKLVDQELDKLLADETYNEDAIKKKIRETQQEIDLMGEQNVGMKRVKEGQVRFMEEKLSAMKLQFQAKMEGIERWRIQMKAKFRVSEEENVEVVPKELLEDDAEIVTAVSRKVLIKIEHPEDKQEFEKLFNRYIGKIKEREQSIQKIAAKSENAKSRLEEITKEKINCEKRMSELEQESIKYKNEFNAISIKEKALERQRDDRNAQLELELQKQGEEDFIEFLKKNEAIFKGVKKTYGAKVAEKIKQEHKKEITDLAIAQQLERRNMIKDVHKTIQHLNQVIESTEAVDKLLPLIESLKKACAEKEAKIQTMNGQLAAVIEAENEAVVQIEDYLHKKKAELAQHLQIFYRKKNYEFTLQRTMEIKAVLEKKKQGVNSLMVHLEALRKRQEDEKTAFAVRKVQQKMKLDATRKQLDEVQKVVKAQLAALGKQINNYNLLIVSDKKKVGILNEKLSNSINNLKLTKQILGQKFRGVEEVCLPEAQTEVIEDATEEDKRESVGAPFSKERESNPALSHDKESVENIVAENALSDRLSMVANPSESSGAPKYGCINVNLADLNVTGSEVDQLPEVDIEEEKEVQEEELGRYIYSSFNEKKSKYKVDITVCPVKELQLFDSIKTLLEGMYIYKKYTTQNLLKVRAFDPLLSQKYPPETCGFGKRFFIYNPNNNKLEFRLLNKPNVVELSLPLTQIQRVIVPNETKKIIKVQRMAGTLAKGAGTTEVDVEKLDKLWREVDNEVFREKCKSVIHYPYSILTKDKRIEIVAETYTIYKYSIQAINQLLVNQSLMKELENYLIREVPMENVENDVSSVKRVESSQFPNFISFTQLSSIVIRI
eukprot:TRINITY_DN120220_c1_g1_i1.p1 TRINITY_DN120220_c1_g1~~TRINITY_DN120220_c1_g1_i1.p1  ORF type:complete len:1293 (+),score=291.69 TRINITY_DN120220_c1_g1_i1:80-3880(+)